MYEPKYLFFLLTFSVRMSAYFLWIGTEIFVHYSLTLIIFVISNWGLKDNNLKKSFFPWRWAAHFCQQPRYIVKSEKNISSRLIIAEQFRTCPFNQSIATLDQSIAISPSFVSKGTCHKRESKLSCNCQVILKPPCLSHVRKKKNKRAPLFLEKAMCWKILKIKIFIMVQRTE